MKCKNRINYSQEYENIWNAFQKNEWVNLILFEISGAWYIVVWLTLVYHELAYWLKQW